MDNLDQMLNAMFPRYLAKKVRKAVNNPTKTITKEVAHAYGFYLMIMLNKLSPNDVAPGGPLHEASVNTLSHTFLRTFYKGITLEKFQERLVEDQGLKI